MAEARFNFRKVLLGVGVYLLVGPSPYVVMDLDEVVPSVQNNSLNESQVLCLGPAPRLLALAVGFCLSRVHLASTLLRKQHFYLSGEGGRVRRR